MVGNMLRREELTGGDRHRPSPHTKYELEIYYKKRYNYKLFWGFRDVGGVDFVTFIWSQASCYSLFTVLRLS